MWELRRTFISTSKPRKKKIQTRDKRVKLWIRVWIYIYMREFSIISVAIPYFKKTDLFLHHCILIQIKIVNAPRQMTIKTIENLLYFISATKTKQMLRPLCLYFKNVKSLCLKMRNIDEATGVLWLLLCESRNIDEIVSNFRKHKSGTAQLAFRYWSKTKQSMRV